MNDVRIVCGDALEVLRKLPDNSLSWCVTDPPYGMNPSLDVRDMLAHWLLGRDFKPKGKGFMGREWDACVPPPKFYAELLRVLKPGAHAVVFAGTRSEDLMGISLRLAGFELRDVLDWLYGTGFPKSLNVAKEIDERLGAERPILHHVERPAFSKGRGHGRDADGAPKYRGINGGHEGKRTLEVTGPGSPEAEEWEGWGTALKPAREPIFLVRKPIEKGLTVAENVLKWGTGAINVGECAIGEADTRRPSGANAGVYGRDDRKNVRGSESGGRFPANVLLDETAAALLDEASGDRPGMKSGGKHRKGAAEGMFGAIDGNEKHLRGDSGGASRFFYVAKAAKREKQAGCSELPERMNTDGRKKDIENPRLRTAPKKNHHPTVKPVTLIRYLIRLVAPPGTLGVDPFLGSGTTAIAALREGVQLLGIELDPEYVEIAKARTTHEEKKRK